jgi:type VI secretion system protein ImpM
MVGLDGADGGPDPRAGFFGKVTSHGDFVARRLAPAFQRRWDDWVQAGLQESRQALGAGWLPTYLSSPIWRFALAPGVCGEQGWAGLLMPSVDRVGRHFPLTLAACAAAPLDCLTGRHAWFDRLEELALSSLREDFSLDEFDAALCALEAPGGAAPGSVIALDAGQALAAQLADPASQVLHRVAAAALRGHSMWWTDGSPQVAPCVLVCAGMPAPAAFAALLDGDWQGRGWDLAG